MRKTLMIFGMLAGGWQMQAAQVVWLEWSGAGGAAGLTGAFGPGGPGGTVTATRSGAVDGGSVAGVPGAVAQNITGLTPTFNLYYGTGNPGTGLPFIANNYNDAGDRYVMTLDFTTLTAGVLPAGSLFAFVDYDISESLKNLTAFTTGGAQVGTAWLSPVGGAGQYIDAATPGDNSSLMPVAAPVLTQTGGIYQVSSAAGNMDSGFLVFVTTADLTGLQWEHFRDIGSSAAGGGGGGIAIGSAVPEPQAWGLAAAGLGVLWLRTRRRA